MSESVPIDYRQGDVTVPAPPYRVFRKEVTAGVPAADWVEETKVDLFRVSDGANTIAQHVLGYQSGFILREGATDYAAEEPVDWKNDWILIEVYGRDGDGNPDYGTVLERWAGIVTCDDRDMLGGKNATSANQLILVEGFESILDSVLVSGAYVASKNPEDNTGDKIAVRVDTRMAFNAPRLGAVRWDRNRSENAMEWKYIGGTGAEEDELKSPTDDTTGVYVFDHVGETTGTWSIGQVLDYVIGLYGPTVKLDETTTLRFRISTLEKIADSGETALADAIKALKASPVELDGRTVFEALNQIIRPERGLGWTLVYDQDFRDGTAGPIIALFSLFRSGVTIDGTSVPASKMKATLDIGLNRDASWQVRDEAAVDFRKVIVRGEPVLCCFTISNKDGSLDKGWTTQEQTEYNAPTGAGSPTSDGYAQRLNDYRARSRVWAEWVLKENWNYKSKGGTNDQTAVVVVPEIKEDGTLNTARAASMSLFEKRFERFIPIEEKKPEAAPDDPNPTYKEPLAFIKRDATGEVGWLDLVGNFNPAAPRLSYFAPLESRPGFRIRCDPAYVLAGDDAPSELGIGVDLERTDWKDMILTVAMRGNRWFKSADIAGSDSSRDLIIDVDGAELWTIAAKTVVGVDVSRNLVRHDGGTVRDDSARLETVLEMAKAWYGSARQPVSLQFRSLCFVLPDSTTEGATIPLSVGRFIEAISDDTVEVDVQTVITRRAFDFAKHVAAIETDFRMRPNFAALA